jgi:hypothetical protein
VRDLTLWLDLQPTFRVNRGNTATIRLVNARKEDRTLAEITALHGQLRHSPEITYVVRFQNGTVYEAKGVAIFWSPSPEEAEKWRPRPITIAAGGEVSSRFDLFDLLIDHDLRVALTNCRTFCITAIVDGIRLKSNTVFVNGHFSLPARYDPFEDAKVARHRAKERYKRRD